MSERAYGNRYNEVGSTKEVAAKVRAELRAMVKKGELPAMKVSVRYSRYAGGSSVDVKLSEVEGLKVYDVGRLLADRDNPREFCRRNWSSEEAAALVKKVEALLASFNHDGSDSMTDYFDVRFYGHVDIDGDRNAELAMLPPPGSKEAWDLASKYMVSLPEKLRPAKAAPSNVVSLDAWVMDKAVKAAAANGIRPILDSTVEGCPAAMWHDNGAPCAICAKVSS